MGNDKKKVKITKALVKRLISLSLNPVPTENGGKAPIRKKHNTTFNEAEIDDYRWGDLEIGISTGFASLNLEALDFDLKNADDPDNFIEEFKELIPKNIFEKLVIQTTPSGGYHYIYRCDKIESNQKLARNKDGAAIIETRGIGGYIKCFPSEGYNIISEKSFDEIPYLTVEERNFLIVISRQKDMLNKDDIQKRYSKEDLDYFARFPEYNEDEQIGIDLLESAGWTFHSRNGEWYNLTRPNSESQELHGGYNTEGKFFQTFSTAQDTFQERRGYNNHALFAELECEGNYKKAYAILYEQGWGKDIENDDSDADFEFLSTFKEENEFLEQARKGEVPLGVSTGWNVLDEHFKFKKNTFYYWLGLDNIGKSTLLASIMSANNILHGSKWGISSPEASVSTTRRVLIEADTGDYIDNLSKDEYDKAMRKSRDNFFIIANKKHYTIEEILRHGKKLYQHYGIDFLIIDPFSFYSGSGNYQDDVEILSKIRVFSQNYCSVIVVDHPYSGFTRSSLDAQGFIKMPTKYDAAGGNVKANKVDDFICFHRIINHPDPDVRKTMQISVQKVKDKFTGGKPHVDGEWDRLIFERRNGFLGYWDEEGNNPMYASKISKLGVRKKMKIKRMSAEEAFS